MTDELFLISFFITVNYIFITLIRGMLFLHRETELPDLREEKTAPNVLDRR